MCGIIGVLFAMKNQNIYKIILDGLIQLQNRGYDSSGIGILNKIKFILHKFASTTEVTAIDKLKNIKIAINSNDEIYSGMGHNRWCTHGAPTDINAHPHISSCGNFMLVHNGIIENYLELKQFLTSSGFTFISQTDTEVIVNLISYYYKRTNDTFIAIKSAINELHGTYGLVIINKSESDTLYCVRNGSPLLIMTSNDNDYAIVASEQSGFCNLGTTYITLKNDDICVIKRVNNKINIITNQKYEPKVIATGIFEISPSPFPYWTIKEIFDQPTTILNAINNGGRLKNNNEVKLGGIEAKTEILKNINNLILLGCGTSYYSGLFSSKFFKLLCNFNTIQVFDGADFESHDIPKIGITALVLISQSGETRDLYRCIKIAKDNNLTTIGIINVVDSLIAREVDCGIYLNAGKEFGVASTKSFSSQVVCLSMLAIWFAQIHKLNESKRIKMITDLRNLSMDIKNTLGDINTKIKSIGIEFTSSKFSNIFILGKGFDEATAKEGALKIKELSYIHAESYSTSSLKHGPFALLDEKFPVILLDCDNEYSNVVNNCYNEIISRKSPVFLITNNISSNTSNNIIKLTTNSTYQSLLGVIPLQLLAYYLSITKKINPDIPRNLAKVVTVN